jgi:hypothetical protein
MMIDEILKIAGAVVPLLSALASLVNHIVRSRQAEDKPVSPALAATGALLNAGAVNVDKAAQLVQMLRAKPVR